MLVYIISALILIMTLLNVYLGAKLYEVPKSENYFDNVTNISLEREKNISASPKYVVTISIITGILLGMYFACASANKVNAIVVLIVALIIFISYLIELTRKITLKDGKIILSKFLSRTKEIDMHRVSGMYIYSYNKKFLNKHAYTTKLVIAEGKNNLTKFTLSSIDNRAVLGMMKDNFGINRNKMFIAKKEKEVIKQ